MNPESEYYTGSDDLANPIYEDVIDIIHRSGGLAFLAHPFEYRIEDTIKFLDDLMKKNELDGIECFHPSANENATNILVEYAKKNNLYISGGSDYHGSKKPNIEIGTGDGNLKISRKMIEEWIDIGENK